MITISRRSRALAKICALSLSIAVGGCAGNGPYETALAATGNMTVTVSPVNPTVLAGQSLQFSAAVTGATDQTVSWFVHPATGVGAPTIWNTGYLTAGAAAGTFTVTAVSYFNPAISGSTTVIVAASGR